MQSSSLLKMFAIARAHRTCTAGRYVPNHLQASQSVVARRNIHQTSVVSKKKKTSSAIETAFEEEEDFATSEGDDLFSNTTTQASAKTPNSADKPKGRLSVEERAVRFDNLYQFLSDRIGLNPPAKARKDPRQVRKTAWQQLFSLAATSEQLERVTELFPKWRDARQQFTPEIAEAFVRRCEELRCPTLALKVFSDHSKYGFNLNHLPAARHLLHSLHVEHPLEDSVTLSALYGVYKLPAISSDLISCAMLTSALFKAKTEESLIVANALVPELKLLLKKTHPAKMAYPTDPVIRNQKNNKEKAWLKWTLLKIEKALEAQKQPVDWLKTWREASISAAGAA
ncbi:hypothetical protein BDY19DRAFT_993604 [Irpex rosettiformis]|uniref:Uncharacterized protein n=1 Tax=Irpex rosettiformis TaxID=378272 RepID=A0ACB8U476_9APHY|nr:hypothetical protein BDY19DRAFT_993604 [Irpex rosettiformis]